MKKIDEIGGTLAEMLLIAEGAISIFEKGANRDDDYSLIGEALYLLRESIKGCLITYQ